MIPPCERNRIRCGRIRYKRWMELSAGNDFEALEPEPENPSSAVGPVIVLVPGYGGRFRPVERWRMTIALKTLADLGGGQLVVSGHGGEAGRLAALAPPEVRVLVEPTARSTFENVERSIPFLLDAEIIAIASDRLHRRRAATYLGALKPELVSRLIEPVYGWREGWWMDATGAVYERLVRVRRAIRERVTRP